MLLRHVYLISLEPPDNWPIWFGIPVGESKTDAFRIELAEAYFNGLTSAAADIDPDSDDLSSFFIWLRDVRRLEKRKICQGPF